MKKIILILILFSFPLKAEIISATGKHKHLGDKTKIQSCRIAEEKAKKNAITQSLGQMVSSDVVSNCSEIDGEYDCERNQFSLFELNGDITSYKVKNKNYDKEIGTDILFCEIEIEAKVVPVIINQDPNFQFNVDLNQQIYRSGETLNIKIDTSQKMYMTIFQWLPYGGKKYNKITKIFPNEKFNKNTKNLINNSVELKYEVYFPEEINQQKVDEYLIFIASESEIPWLDEYSQIEGLKSQMNKNKILMEKHYTGYIVIK